MTYNTLQHGEHTFRDVISVTLGFQMCSHCLSMLFLFFFWLKEWQIHFGRIDLVRANCYRANRPSGETTWYPREYERSPLFSLPVPEPVREPASMLLARFSRASRALLACFSLSYHNSKWTSSLKTIHYETLCYPTWEVILICWFHWKDCKPVR